MTHTLHRQGSVESLEKDYSVLALVARQFDLQTEESKTSAVKRLRGISDVMASNDPVNMGSIYVPGTYAHDLTAEQIKAGLKPNGFVLSVYDSQEKLKEVLSELKEKDFGISITVSGLIDRVFDTCDEIGLAPHTISYSMGVWGKKELLPKMEILEITSMCGHAMTSANLVKKTVADIKAGKTTAQAAAKEIARPCACGCFNTERAAALLQQLAISN